MSTQKGNQIVPLSLLLLLLLSAYPGERRCDEGRGWRCRWPEIPGNNTMGHAKFLTQSLNIYVYRDTWGVDSYVHANENLYRILYVMYRIALSHAHHVCHKVTTHHGNGRGHSGHEVYCGRKLVENSDHVPIFARITGHPVGVSVSLHSPPRPPPR